MKEITGSKIYRKVSVIFYFIFYSIQVIFPFVLIQTLVAALHLLDH